MIHSMKRSLVEVPLKHITVSKANMRSYYDPEALEALDKSMARVGQIYPVLLRRLPQEDHYELILGSRRFKAAWRAGMKTIQANVLDDISQPEIVMLSLTENLHREDLTPFEEAKAILELTKTHGMSPKEVSQKIQKPVHWITGRLKILSVPPPSAELAFPKSRDNKSRGHSGVTGKTQRPNQVRQDSSQAGAIGGRFGHLDSRRSFQGGCFISSPRTAGFKWFIHSHADCAEGEEVFKISHHKGQATARFGGRRGGGVKESLEERREDHQRFAFAFQSVKAAKELTL